MAAKPKKSLRSLAQRTTPGDGDRRKISVVDTFEGLRDDLAATIADQNAKPARDRHSIKAIYTMACSVYEGLDSQLTYNGFWKYITKTFNYRGAGRPEN